MSFTYSFIRNIVRLKKYSIGVALLLIACGFCAMLPGFSASSHGPTNQFFENNFPQVAGRESGAPAARLGGELFDRLPLSFEINEGQAAAQFKFVGRSGDSKLFLTANEAVLALCGTDGRAPDHIGEGPTSTQSHRSSSPGQSAFISMKMVGANARPRVSGLDRLPGKVNLFSGNDSKKWRTGIDTYAKVFYQNIYRGIDLIYYGNQRQLEYDFIIHPGSDPHAIRLSYSGADSLTVDADGDLLLGVGSNLLRQPRPTIYQEVAGTRREIEGRYVQRGKVVGFAIGPYDRTKNLVIDPVLTYSTYVGGNNLDEGKSIAVDAAGNAYVTGWTVSPDFPIRNAIQAANGNRDVFITKLNPSGTAVIYSTYFGGGSNEEGNGIAVDSAGNAYLTGYTQSTNLPVVNPIQTFGGVSDAFVAKLSASGATLLYSTYLGGTGAEEGKGIALDINGNAYVTGWTDSTNFQTASPLQPARGGGEDAFVAKLNGSGTALLYSTYFGGVATDQGRGIAVDSSGNAYVTGLTGSSNWPTSNAIGSGGSYDAFVLKLNATGTAVLYSTRVGGNSDDRASAVAVDSSGNAYLTGSSMSTNFPTLTPIIAANSSAANGGTAAFISKLNSSGSALIYSTYLCGSNDSGTNAELNTAGNSIALDSAGNAYITGSTQSTGFPLVNPLQTTTGGVFVSKLNTAGTGFIYSTYLGRFNDVGYGIATDSSANAYVTGFTSSSIFPTAPERSSFGGVQDAFITKIGTSAPTTVQFSSAKFSATEAYTSIFITVTRDGDLSGTTTVDYFVNDDTATQKSNYTFAAGRLTFAPGETSQTFPVLLNDESYVKGNLSAIISLTNVSGASAASPSVVSLEIADNDPPFGSVTNVIDDPRNFVYQHYHDFLNREPDAGGLAYWTNQIAQCQGNADCIQAQRINVSAAFFIEQEFQQTGFYIYRLYKATLNERVGYVGFMTDRSRLAVGPSLAASRDAYTHEFVQRREFVFKYALSLSGPEFVGALIEQVDQSSGVNLSSHRDELIAEYNKGVNQTDSRARVLMKFVEYPEFTNAEYNRAFVLMQYFEYLRRDVDEDGYKFWLNVLNNKLPGNYRGMVCAFITSAEYQLRFGPLITHSNAECR